MLHPPVGNSFLNLMYLECMDGSSRSVCLSRTRSRWLGQAMELFRVETRSRLPLKGGGMIMLALIWGYVNCLFFKARTCRKLKTRP